MKKKNIYLIVAFVVVAGIFLSFALLKPATNTNQNHNAAVAGSQTLTGYVGKQAPDFTLKDLNGNTVSLSDYRGKKNIVLFFSEGAMCYPACWNQIAAFAGDGRFHSSTTEEFSIVVDTPQEWQQIISQTPEMKGAALLFDTQRSASQAYGVLNLPSSMHPGLFPGHTYFVIDKTGTIQIAQDDPMMAIRNDELWSEMQKLN